MPLPQYTFRTLAARIAEGVPHDSDVVVLGHSLGGVVGLTLAGRDFGLSVSRVIGLGIKVAWSDEELRRAQSVADRPTTWFDTRDEAAQRYLRIAGLAGLVAADAPMVDAGLRLDGDRWRLALDVRAFGVGAPDMANLLAGANADVLLARGEHDAMSTDDELAAWGTRSVMLAGLGHNAHVENPDAVAVLIG